MFTVTTWLQFFLTNTTIPPGKKTRKTTKLRLNGTFQQVLLHSLHSQLLVLSPRLLTNISKLAALRSPTHQDLTQSMMPFRSLLSGRLTPLVFKTAVMYLPSLRLLTNIHKLLSRLSIWTTMLLLSTLGAIKVLILELSKPSSLWQRTQAATL